MPRWSDDLNDEYDEDGDTYVDVYDVLERIELREALAEDYFYGEQENDDCTD